MIDKSKIFIIFSYIFVIYISLLALIFIFQRSLMYLPIKEKISKSFYENTQLKIIDVNTSDGLILKSLYKKSEENINKTILVLHGNTGHIGHRVKKFKPFIEKGYGLLLLEYRGYGENLGKPTEEGLIKDGYAALKYLFNQNISPKNIILYGESLGTGIATKLSTDIAFNATILEAPFTSIADVAQSHYWIFPSKWLVLDRFNSIGIIKKIKSPLLVIHGNKDKIIDIKFGKKIFNYAPKPKERIFILQAGHNNLFEFNIFEKILRFLSKYQDK